MSGTRFYAVNPATGERLEPAFCSAVPADVDAACSLAAGASAGFARSPGGTRGALLRGIARALEARADVLVSRCREETGLAEARLRGELARTCSQLLLFAATVEEGSWVDARIDHADPHRTPVPKPDVRSMLRPRGPVAVFGAGNFPLAFSVAGGDTASALAAGCPVIVKAHPAHPGTSELAALAVEEAVRRSGLPGGIFSLLFDAGFDAARALVAHPAMAAVGFTGSRTGGVALAEIAARRPSPIPVFAEMGSVNPVIILEGALAGRAPQIAAGLYGSVTLGVGQFCTNPGLVFLPRTEGTDGFLRELERHIEGGVPGVMVSEGSARRYRAQVEERSALPGVRRHGMREVPAGFPAAAVAPAVFSAELNALRGLPGLVEEIFGPCTVVVLYEDAAALRAAVQELPGQLTFAVHAGKGDLDVARELLTVVESRAGRVVFNGFPTGVEVSHAMVHGGPYPATLDGASTSVGTLAIRRFTRQVCFQDVPDELLPAELKEGNPAGILRFVDGRWVRDGGT